MFLIEIFSLKAESNIFHRHALSKWLASPTKIKIASQKIFTFLNDEINSFKEISLKARNKKTRVNKKEKRYLNFLFKKYYRRLFKIISSCDSVSTKTSLALLPSGWLTIPAASSSSINLAAREYPIFNLRCKSETEPC